MISAHPKPQGYRLEVQPAPVMLNPSLMSASVSPTHLRMLLAPDLLHVSLLHVTLSRVEVPAPVGILIAPLSP
jgi:hypothetical protein